MTRECVPRAHELVEPTQKNRRTSQKHATCVSEITHRHTFTFTQALHTPRRVPHGGGLKGRHAHVCVSRLPPVPFTGNGPGVMVVKTYKRGERTPTT